MQNLRVEERLMMMLYKAEWAVQSHSFTERRSKPMTNGAFETFVRSGSAQ